LCPGASCFNACSFCFTASSLITSPCALVSHAWCIFILLHGFKPDLFRLVLWCRMPKGMPKWRDACRRTGLATCGLLVRKFSCCVPSPSEHLLRRHRRTCSKTGIIGLPPGAPNGFNCEHPCFAPPRPPTRQKLLAKALCQRKNKEPPKKCGDRENRRNKRETAEKMPVLRKRHLLYVS